MNRKIDRILRLAADAAFRLAESDEDNFLRCSALERVEKLKLKVFRQVVALFCYNIVAAVCDKTILVCRERLARLK